jgi:hypothetical protein
MKLSELSQISADVKNKQVASGYVYTTKEDFTESQQVYVEQVSPITITHPQALDRNMKKLHQLKALYGAAIQPLLDEDRRIHDLALERAKEERQDRFPDIDFSTTPEPWLPEYNLTLDPEQSEYEQILKDELAENASRLMMRLQDVIADILLGTTHGKCTITKDGDSRQCRTDKLYPWMAHGWVVEQTKEIVND